MQFRITIDCDNAAFEEDPVYELQRIINDGVFAVPVRLMLRRYFNGEAPFVVINLRDSNGNTVGKAEFIDA